MQEQQLELKLEQGVNEVEQQLLGELARSAGRIQSLSDDLAALKFLQDLSRGFPGPFPLPPSAAADEDLDDELLTDDDNDDSDEDEDYTSPTWDAYFSQETLAIAFRLAYDNEDGSGVAKVEYDEEADSWYFHDTFYNTLDVDVVIYTSNFLFRQPGAALNAACEWLRDNR